VAVVEIQASGRLMRNLFLTLITTLALGFIANTHAAADDETAETTYQQFREAARNSSSAESTVKFRPKPEQGKQASPEEQRVKDSIWLNWKKNAAVDLKLVDKNIGDDAATLVYKPSDANSKRKITVHLIKEDGAWKVANEDESSDGTAAVTNLANTSAAIQAAIEKPATSNKWVLAAASAPFAQTKLAGKIDGKSFAPSNCDVKFYHDPLHPGYGALIALDDFSSATSAKITLSALTSLQNVQVAQAARSATSATADLGLRDYKVAKKFNDIERGQFGLHLSFGKPVSAKKIPLYLVLRLDKDNWFQGYAYAEYSVDQGSR
jgi:hypothetical protein